MSLAVLLLAVSVLIVGLGLVVFGQASDVRGKAQKAADAASLAAAEAAKVNWIQAWVHGQVVPDTEEDDDASRDLDIFAASAGGSGYWQAVSFAQANSSSTVRNYSSSTPGFRTVQIIVDIDSEVVDAQGTTADMIGDVQGDATATAELSVAEGVTCTTDGGEWEDDGDTLITWTITCTGNGASASVQYDGSGNAVSYDISAFGRLFDDVRLIN